MAITQESLGMAARFGYAARGVVYILVGGLSALAGIGAGGDAAGSTDALKTVLEQPFGAVLLGILAAGLLGFGLWRLIGTILDADHHGTSGKGLAVRGAHLVSAAIHAGLAAWAAKVAIGASSGGGGGAQSWTAWLMGLPFGTILVGIVGAGVIAAGIALLGVSWKGSFRKRLSCDRAAETWLVPLGRAGYAARGTTFILIGGFLLAAAWRHDPGSAQGLGEALQTLREQPYGGVMLAIVAAGLFAFGAFGVAQAFYRRINVKAAEGAARALKPS